MGQQYLDIITRDPDVFGRMDLFRENDEYGGPLQFDYPSVWRISPSTLRYVKVLADLKERCS